MSDNIRLFDFILGITLKEVKVLLCVLLLIVGAFLCDRHFLILYVIECEVQSVWIFSTVKLRNPILEQYIVFNFMERIFFSVLDELLAFILRQDMVQDLAIRTQGVF